jgi:transcriptional regulator with XRE-family HTH domain
MFDLNDVNDIVAFKTRLSEIRKRKRFTQDSFAEALHFGDRSRIANWESKKSTTVLKLSDFTTVCKLLDVDPNYLLGVSDIQSSNDKAISDAIGLSCTNVQKLRTCKFTSKFLDYMLSSLEIDELIRRIKQICHYGFVSEAQETTFSHNTLKKIEKAFEEFHREVSPLDMNKELFSEYIRDALPWNRDQVSFDCFIKSTISENEYNNILFEYPDFEEKPDTEKYNVLIDDIAATSYDYMMIRPIVELAEHKILTTLDDIIKKFIHTEINNFKNHNKTSSE